MLVACSALLSAALFLATGASAAPVRFGTAERLDEGPLLAGGALAYTQATREEFSVRTDRARARPVVLASDSLDNSDDVSSATQFVSLAASAQRLAYSDFSSFGNQLGSGSSVSLASGPLSGPLANLVSCGSVSGPFGGPSETVNEVLDVDASAVAYVGCDGRVVVRNFAPGAPVATRVLPDVGGVSDLRLAGRYVAVVTPTSVRVLDWVANTAQYTAPLPGGDSTTVDIQADGTIAVVRARDVAVPCPEASLAWYSRSQPFAHPLGPPPCTAAVRIAAGRIAVISRASRGRRLLTAVTLGGTRSGVASLGAAGVQAGEFDLDGSRASYALRNCLGGADLLVASLASTGPLGSVGTRCPVVIVSPRATVRGRGVALRVRCTRGCAGRGRLERRVGRRTVGLGSARRVRLRASRRSRRVRFGLSRSARRMLATRGVLRARLSIAARDRAGKRRVTRRRVELRAR